MARYTLLVVAWITVATRTARASARGSLFLPLTRDRSSRSLP
jgi:hypothetical protein